MDTTNNKVNKNMKIWGTVVVVVLLVAAFYGGSKYGADHALAARTTARGTFTAGAGGAGFAGRTGAGGAFGAGGAAAGSTVTSGTVVSMDSTGLTLSLRTGGSIVVLAGASTPVTKTVSDTLSSVTVGSAVNIVGTKNSDGSVTATSIMIPSAAQQAAMQAALASSTASGATGAGSAAGN